MAADESGGGAIGGEDAHRICAPESSPRMFGGDRAVLIVPPRRRQAMHQARTRVRGAARLAHGMRLRVGTVRVSALRTLGSDLCVARYEPTPGNKFCVCTGGGVSALENAIRGRAWPELGAQANVSEILDDGAPVNLNGWSC
ncbi:MAG: DUF3095 family protein [Burkholderiales bacterium]|nr:DUF3095 family protein [Burkholderiales bacterium]